MFVSEWDGGELVPLGSDFEPAKERVRTSVVQVLGVARPLSPH